MRAFLAIDIPNEQKNWLSNLLSELNVCHLSQLRPVRSDSLHITIKYLPYVSTTQIGHIVDATSSAVSDFESFSLNLGPIGCFPHIRNPTSLWIGLVQPHSQLPKLHTAIQKTLKPRNKRENAEGH